MLILRLELKRMLKGRLTRVLLPLALLLSLLMAYLPVTFCYTSYTDPAGNEVQLTGLASAAYEKEQQAGASGSVTPERVRQAVETYQACLREYGVTESYDLPEGVYERDILPIAPLLHGVKEAFADPDTGMAPAIMEISPAEIDGYYAVCEARLASLMALEQPDSPAARRIAAEMYRQVTKPFTVYPGMSSAVMDYQNIMGFLVLLFCVVIAAPVFSSGYQSGADSILRCTRHGRARLGAAKVAGAPGYLNGAHSGDLGEHSGIYGQDLRAGDGGHTADAGLPGEHVACHDGGDAAVGLGDPLGHHAVVGAEADDTFFILPAEGRDSRHPGEYVLQQAKAMEGLGNRVPMGFCFFDLPCVRGADRGYGGLQPPLQRGFVFHGSSWRPGGPPRLLSIL